jgi:hypothetical protein
MSRGLGRGMSGPGEPGHESRGMGSWSDRVCIQNGFIEENGTLTGEYCDGKGGNDTA